MIGFLADDLTGAGDVLSQMHRYGLDARLVLSESASPLPTDLDVVGIAGPIRSAGFPEHASLVRAGLDQLAGINPHTVLYKVCSTFDSAPDRGSIGSAIEFMHERWPIHGPIPVVPAQPEFGRFTCFSHQFADSAGETFRLDRHPTASSHPSTPMRESDLRRLLADQMETGTPGYIHLPDLIGSADFHRAWDTLCHESRPSTFIVDAVTDRHLDMVAERLAVRSAGSRPSLVVGSGGIAAAIGRSITSHEGRQMERPPPRGPVLALSASASDITAKQIGYARAQGWIEIGIPGDLIRNPSDGDVASLVETADGHLARGRHVVIHSVLGPKDPRLQAEPKVDARALGQLLGTIASVLTATGKTRRVAFMGGDTTTHALSTMSVGSIRVTSQFVTAGPVCMVAGDPTIEDCEFLFKGGQVGPENILPLFAGEESSTGIS